MKIKPKIGLVARPGTHSAGERTEIHVSGLDVKPHLVGVGERLAALWTLFVLLLLVHVEDMAPEGLFASEHPEMKGEKLYTEFLSSNIRVPQDTCSLNWAKLRESKVSWPGAIV